MWKLSLEDNSAIMNSSAAPDFFYREAKRLQYVARSAFKLIEMQKKHRIIRRGASVLDLGCAPGAWLQVACQNLGPVNGGGVVVGVDIKKVKVPACHCDYRVQTMCADVLKVRALNLANISPQGRGFSVILSDMCPAVTGIGIRDAAESIHLGMCAFHLALGTPALLAASSMIGEMKVSESSKGILLQGGNAIVKLLEGEDCQVFFQLYKEYFNSVTWFRPKATRPSSREIYLIAMGRR